MRLSQSISLKEIEEEFASVREAELLAYYYHETLMEELYPDEPQTLSASDLISLVVEDDHVFIEYNDRFLTDTNLDRLWKHLEESESGYSFGETAMYPMKYFREDIWTPGSASGADAHTNVPKVNGKPNYRWNHDFVRAPQAIQFMSNTTNPQRNKLDGPTGIRLFQLDTGYSIHDSFFNSDCYKHFENGNVESTGFIGDEEDAKNLAIDSLNEYNIGLGNRQKPSHATATGFTIIGNRGISEDDFAPIENIKKIE